MVHISYQHLLSWLTSYNQLDREQLGMCTVELKHNVKSVKHRFFVVPDEGPVLFRMPGIKLLNILRIACEVISEPHESLKFGSQTIEASNNCTCRTNRTLWNKGNKVDTYDNNINMSDYIRFRTNKVADKRVSEVLTKNTFWVQWCF